MGGTNLNIYFYFILKIILLFCAIIFFSFKISLAQDTASYSTNDAKLNLGLGIGIDYGGIGIRLSALAASHVSLFIAAGYNLNGLGYNFGAAYRFTPFYQTCFYYTMMYGYNAVIIIKDTSQYNKTFYGISPGFGVELHSRKRHGNFLNLELLIPLRTQEYRDYIIDLQNNSNIIFKSKSLPFTISMGFHIKLEWDETIQI